MRKKGFNILLVSLLVILIVLTGNQYINDNTSDSLIFYRSALKINKNELALHTNVIGNSFKRDDIDSPCKLINNKTFTRKIIIVLMDKEDKQNDYVSTVVDAIDFYAELKDTSSLLQNTGLILSTRKKFNKLFNYTEKYYKNSLNIYTDTSGIFGQLYKLTDRGAVVMLLNGENVCLYAYYLEKDNNRKLYENSAVIFRLIKNLNEEKI